MDINRIIFLVVLIIAIVAIAYLVSRILAKKFAIGGQTIVNNFKTGLEVAETVAEEVDSYLPGPINSLIDNLIKYAHIAVAAAEQMAKNAQIPEAERKDYATTVVKDCLDLLSIEITPQIEKLISAFIEAAVKYLPKTHEVPAKTTKVSKNV